MSETNAKERIYLDHAAATPLHPSVLEAMMPYLTKDFGNPSAIHAEGQAARLAVETARQDIATVLGLRPAEVIFTASGTESNNLAINGYLAALASTGRTYDTMEVITTAIEHPSVLALWPQLQTKGVKVHFAPLKEDGQLDVSAITTLLTPQTVLVTIGYVNSEIGTIQPLSRIARTIRDYERTSGTKICLHTDAAQAPLWLPCSLSQLGVDMLSLDAGKCCGPKGVGILAARHHIVLQSIMAGGGQEGGKRPGTENVASIVGAACALKIASAKHEERSLAVSVVRTAAIAYLTDVLREAIINGGSGEDRVANNINFSLPGVDTEFAVVTLDAQGIAASTKSACAGAGGGASHVVAELTGDNVRAKSTIRLTLGEGTTESQIRTAIDCLSRHVAKMKSLTV